MKDPAFLFYTKDFQSGTQDMSCEEVGAFLRLLLYQHQHGHIPSNIERLMRITGIFSTEKFNMVWQMVSHKFSEKGEHLVNHRLQIETTLRATAKPKKLASATLAGLISANKTLTDKQKFSIKKAFKITDYETLNENEISKTVKEWFYKMLNQMVNNLANENADANVIEIEIEKGKEGSGEKPDENGSLTSASVAGSPLLRRGAGGEVVLPFASAEFTVQWQAWKRYRAAEHNFTYRSAESEQAALAELGTLAHTSEATAIAILHQSMGKGWKGFFELKHDATKPAAGKGKVRYSDDFKRKIANRLQSK